MLITILVLIFWSIFGMIVIKMWDNGSKQTIKEPHVWTKFAVLCFIVGPVWSLIVLGTLGAKWTTDNKTFKQIVME